MKRLIVLLTAFFSVVFAWSQNYTQKWNSVFKRVEFYDSYGTLQGWAKYNDVFDRTEYYDSRGNMIKYEKRNDVFNRTDVKDRSITPDYLGSLLENMFSVTEQLGAIVFGEEKTGTATLGNLYCSGYEAAPIQSEGGPGYYQMSKEFIDLSAGQHLHVNGPQLPKILVFVRRYEEGAYSLGVWTCDSMEAIDYTATEDVTVALAMSNEITTVESVDYTISREPLLNRIMALEQAVDAIPEPEKTFTVLDINVFESKTKFIPDMDFNKVWNAMQQNMVIPVAIQVNYSSGMKVMYYATCVKQGYISIHAKAGSCELHLSSDGSFTISGTSLW